MTVSVRDVQVWELLGRQVVIYLVAASVFEHHGTLIQQSTQAVLLRACNLLFLLLIGSSLPPIICLFIRLELALN